jgi:hypothetical protein
LDFFELADINRDGMIDYKEYIDLFTIMDDHHQQQQQQLNTIDTIELNDNDYDNVDAIDIDNDSAVTIQNSKNRKSNNFVKVEPYGTEILRELIIQRKLKEQNRIRDERIRKQIYAEELDIKINFWKGKINNFESELENIKDGDRDQWSREDYNEAAKIVYQKYKEKLNERFNKIENQTIKKESIENLNQEEKNPNEDFFERLNNLKKIMKDSIDSYKQELRPKIEEDDKEEFEKADSIPKLNTYYQNVIQNRTESYSIIKLKERLLFKEYNQKNIKKLNVNERTKYFKNLLKNR